MRAHSSACTQEPFEQPFLRFSSPLQPSSVLPPPPPSFVQPPPRDFLLLSDFLSQFAIGGKDPGRPEVRVSVKRDLIHSQKRPNIMGRPRSHVPDSTRLHKTAVHACLYLDPTLTHAFTHMCTFTHTSIHARVLSCRMLCFTLSHACCLSYFCHGVWE